MARITLWFSSLDDPELVRVYFEHHRLPGKLRAVRGKSGGAFGNERTFQWTTAVKALCGLLLETAANIERGADPSRQCCSAILEGGAGTAASSLDYALGKETSWLCDIFGIDARGRPLCRTLFRRTNPERKLPGPTAVALDVASWGRIDVRIQAGERQISGEALSSLARRFSPRPEGSELERRPSESARLDLERLRCMLEEVLMQELTSGFSNTDIFTRESVTRLAARIENGASFRRVSGGRSSLLNPLDLELASEERLGLCAEAQLRREFCSSRPLRVSLGVPTACAAALFYYLMHVKGYNIEMDVRHVHAVEIARKLLKHELNPLPDCTCLGMAPAATILCHSRSVGYVPFLLMPSTSQRLVCLPSARSQELRLEAGSYGLIYDDPSVPSFVFEELCAAGHLEKRSAAVSHLEPDDTFRRLHDGDSELRSILFFPHYHFNAFFNRTLSLALPDSPGSVTNTALFVHSSLMRDRQRSLCLNIALRDAWLDLKNPASARKVAKIMLDDPDYFKVLIRGGGLHLLQ